VPAVPVPAVPRAGGPGCQVRAPKTCAHQRGIVAQISVILCGGRGLDGK